MKFILYARELSRKNRNVVSELIELIPKKDLYAIPEIASKLGLKKSNLSSGIVLAIGGDGTTLTVGDLVEKEIPILPIHTGQVGFLSEIGQGDLKKKIPLLLKGNYRIEKRKRLEAHINGKAIGDALNEVSVISSLAVKTCVLQVIIDGKLFETFEGDGVIVSTPTGSTAYSLSAGGPIIDPRTEAFVITPISPYTLKARPLVIPSSSKIEIVTKEGSCHVVIDGIKEGTLTHKDKLIMKRSRYSTKFIRFGEAFYNKLDTLVR